MAHIAGRLEIFTQRVAKAWLRANFLRSRLPSSIRLVAFERRGREKKRYIIHEEEAFVSCIVSNTFHLPPIVQKFVQKQSRIYFFTTRNSKRNALSVAPTDHRNKIDRRDDENIFSVQFDSIFFSPNIFGPSSKNLLPARLSTSRFPRRVERGGFANNS